MRRKFWLILLATLTALCLCLGITACDDKKPDNTVSDGTQTEQPDDGGGTQTPSDGGTQPSVNEYTVTYDANGGKFSDGKSSKSITVKEDGKLSKPETPTREKYVFVSWCTDSSLAEEWDFAEDSVTKTTTLYAKWESAIVEHDVTFILNYEGAKEVVKSTEDGIITYVPEREDYVFNGWWLNDGQTESGEYILAQKWDTSEIVTEDGLKLVAEWVEKSTVSSQLPAPSVSIDANVFTWTAIPGAISYDIRINVSGSREEVSKVTVQNTSWTFPSGYETGYYTVKIRAIGDGETTVNSSYVSKSYGHLILSAISDISFDITTSILTWTAVKNATRYVLYIDEAEVETLTYTTFDLSDYEAGEYSVKIVATRDGYQSSTTSKTINKLRLKTPDVTIEPDENGIEYTISWDSVLHADTYIVTINGEEHRIADFSYVLDRTAESWGDIETISVTVAAFDSEADYLRSNPSEEQTVERVYSLTINISDKAAGSVSIEKKGCIPNEKITLTATTNKGYTWVGWYMEENEVTPELSFQVIMGKENVTYEARWALDPALADFKFTSTPTTCTITGVNDTTKTEYIIPDYVTEVNCGAFKNCSNVQSMTIPFVGGSRKTSKDTYQYPFGYIFGTSAYDGASAVEQRYHDSSTSNVIWTTYYLPDSLKSVTVTGGEILDGAFYECSGLESVTIPDNVASIGVYAFNDCRGLTSITIPDSVTLIEVGAFRGCSELTSITIPDSVTSIEDLAFEDCSELTSIMIPDGVPSIGERTFHNCSRLTSITIPDSVTSIGYSAFEGCSGLESVIWNAENCTTAGSTCFEDCTTLKTVTFGENVKSIPPYTFSDCHGLTEIIVDKDNCIYHSDGNCLIETNSKSLILGCKTSIIPNDGSVTSIGEGAFYNCRGLTSITIPDSVTSIGEEAFSYYNGLKAVYYTGTPQKWNEISIGLNNTDLTNATRYYFTEDEPTEEEWWETENWWHYDDVTGEIVIWKKDA